MCTVDVDGMQVVRLLACRASNRRIVQHLVLQPVGGGGDKFPALFKRLCVEC